MQTIRNAKMVFIGRGVVALSKLDVPDLESKNNFPSTAEYTGSFEPARHD
jgi:hypothetical protein